MSSPTTSCFCWRNCSNRRVQGHRGHLLHEDLHSSWQRRGEPLPHSAQLNPVSDAQHHCRGNHGPVWVLTEAPSPWLKGFL